MQETLVRSLDQDDPLEKGMAAHSSVLAWEIPWTEEPGGLQSTGSQRVGHDRATEQQLLSCVSTTCQGWEPLAGLCPLLSVPSVRLLTHPIALCNLALRTLSPEFCFRQFEFPVEVSPSVLLSHRVTHTISQPLLCHPHPCPLPATRLLPPSPSHCPTPLLEAGG